MNPWYLLQLDEAEGNVPWRAAARAAAEREKGSSEKEKEDEPVKVATGKIPSAAPKKPEPKRPQPSVAPKGGPARPDPRAELIKRRAELSKQQKTASGSSSASGAVSKKDLPTKPALGGRFVDIPDDMKKLPTSDPKIVLPRQSDLSPLNRPRQSGKSAPEHEFGGGAISPSLLATKQQGKVGVGSAVPQRIDPKKQSNAFIKAMYTSAKRYRDSKDAGAKRAVMQGLHKLDPETQERILNVMGGARTKYEQYPQEKLYQLARTAAKGDSKANKELSNVLSQADEKTREELLAILQGIDPEHWDSDEPEASRTQSDFSPDELSHGPPAKEPAPYYGTPPGFKGHVTGPSYPEHKGQRDGEVATGYLDSKWKWSANAGRWEPMGKVPLRLPGKPDYVATTDGQASSRSGEAPMKKQAWYDKNDDIWKRRIIQGKPEKGTDIWVWSKDEHDWLRPAVYNALKMKKAGKQGVDLPKRSEPQFPEAPGIGQRKDPKRNLTRPEKEAMARHALGLKTPPGVSIRQNKEKHLSDDELDKIIKAAGLSSPQFKSGFKKEESLSRIMQMEASSLLSDGLWSEVLNEIE